jgi:glycosyltransferase involved in cell wall biosynthesis
MVQSILLFADRLPPLPGGMEVHAGYFIDYFANHPQFPLAGIITKNANGENCLLNKAGKTPLALPNILNRFDPTIAFFNSGRWIEELHQIQEMLPYTKFIYRTGGNEIIKASLAYNKIPIHKNRQAYWVTTLNQTIDLIITNSAHTEDRLQEINITCPFERVVGGVNTAALQNSLNIDKLPMTLFCAARFVPYKNHTLLITLIHNLISRGHNFQVRLAGDGPLLSQIQEQVKQYKLESAITFLGVLDNEETCREIAKADIYIQLSCDYPTEVEGGSYIHCEGMGRSILEALTAGTYVIAGNSGALSEIVTKERGLLVNLENLEQLTAQIENILRNPPSRQPFSSTYCWTNIFKHYEETFERLA